MAHKKKEHQKEMHKEHHKEAHKKSPPMSLKAPLAIKEKVGKK